MRVRVTCGFEEARLSERLVLKIWGPLYLYETNPNYRYAAIT